jgi:hypothetical protein
MDLCGVCQKAAATETHHIRYQQDATSQGFIKDTHIHKNLASNLVPLCTQCHLQEHHGSLKINGWKQTTNGVELDYTITEEQENREQENKKAEQTNQTNQNIEELIHIWKPYLRYTRRGWVIRKSLSQRTKFKEIAEEKLLEAMSKITAVPSCLVPTSLYEIEQLQTKLLDVSL